MTAPRDSPPAALVGGGTTFPWPQTSDPLTLSARQNAIAMVLINKGICTKAELEAGLWLVSALRP
jgi:hypothetical protein